MAYNRKQQIIDIACQLIAEKGFEGIRTREIADRVSINHATVHYHFKDKETLIAAVVQTITEKIYQTDTDPLTLQSESAREKLATYLCNNLLQRQRYPERFIVLGELTMRANRDQKIEQILLALDENWYTRMQAVLDAGVESGEFRQNLHTKSIAMLLINLLRGMPIRLNQADIEGFMTIYHQIEQDMLIER